MRPSVEWAYFVDTVLERIGKNATPAKAGSSEPAKLLADIVAFRGKSAGLSPERAATEWLALWERAHALDPARVRSDYSAMDAETRRPVGLSSALAALPQPSAWPALRQQAVARAKQKPDDAASKGLQLITEFLSGDKTAVFHSLSGFERAVDASSPDERERKGLALDRARAIVYKLYGSREQIAEGFSASVGAQVLRRYAIPVEVPDLVGLVGSVKAEALLRQALRKPVSLHVAEGEATRALARKLALSQLATLRKPQWGLIDGVGTASLYEAMQKRFEPAAAETKGRPDEGDGGDFDSTRQQADTYYFLDMVIAGRHEDAERAMVRAAGSRGGLNVPKEAMAALVRGGKNQALYEFLAKLLERRPELQAWGAYLEQAGYVGRSNDAIVLIDAILKRPALPRYLRVELQRKAPQRRSASRRSEGCLGSPRFRRPGLLLRAGRSPCRGNPTIATIARRPRPSPNCWRSCAARTGPPKRKSSPWPKSGAKARRSEDPSSPRSWSSPQSAPR